MKSRPTAVAALLAAVLALSACTGGTTPEPEPSETASAPVSATPSVEPEPEVEIRVNQIGYFPASRKTAVLFEESNSPVEWRLVNDAGTVLTSGKSNPAGLDETTGKKVHTIDFTSFTSPGESLRLETDDLVSYPFRIGYGLYQQMQPETMNWLYVQRSGTSIDNYLLNGYGRPAGHTRDAWTECPPATDSYQKVLAAKQQGPWTCDFTMNLSGGWYDAGDTGKYTVNGALAVSYLLRATERAMPGGDPGPASKDGVLRIPEAQNNQPDFFDEAKWELSWLMKARVPSGPYEGLAIHKMGNVEWGFIPQNPATDVTTRYAYQPSVEATFYSAAVLAQGSRIARSFDAPLANQYQAAAISYYETALLHMGLTAPEDDLSIDADPGTTAYAGADVEAARYWAVTELFLADANPSSNSYEMYLESHPLTAQATFGDVAFDWTNVVNIAKLDLARKSRTNFSMKDKVTAEVRDAANTYLAAQASSPWGIPYAPKTFEDRSVQHIVSNATVLITAFDLTGDPKYSAGAEETANWLLGMNGVNRSFLTGMGTNAVQNQVSVIFAHSVDGSLAPPRGSTTGGPNGSALADGDRVIGALAPGCIGQMCQVDDIRSLYTNSNDVATQASVAALFAFLNRT